MIWNNGFFDDNIQYLIMNAKLNSFIQSFNKKTKEEYKVKLI